MSFAKRLTRNPLRSFFILTFAISWAIWTPLVINYYRNPFPISFANTPPFLILLALLGFFGPTFAALIMAGLENGGSGIKALLSGWKKWRVGAGWYLAIVLSQLAIEWLAIQYYISQYEPNPEINWSLWYLALPALLQSAFIGGALAEESGWRGYALPRLQASHSALKSSLIIGFIWAVWHLPISLIPGANFPVPLTLSVFAIFLLNVVFISIIMTWLFNNTKGSLFIGYVYHALLNTALLGSVFRFANIENLWMVKVSFSMALHGLFALILLLVFGSARLSRKSPPLF